MTTPPVGMRMERANTRIPAAVIVAAAALLAFFSFYEELPASRAFLAERILAVIGIVVAITPLWRFSRSRDTKELVLSALVGFHAFYYFVPFLYPEEAFSRPFMGVPLDETYSVPILLFAIGFVALFVSGFGLVSDKPTRNPCVRIGTSSNLKISPRLVASVLVIGITIKILRVDYYIAPYVFSAGLVTQFLFAITLFGFVLTIVSDPPWWLKVVAWGVIFPLNYIATISGSPGLWMLENAALVLVWLFHKHRVPVLLIVVTLAAAGPLYAVRDFYRAQILFNPNYVKQDRITDGMKFIAMALDPASVVRNAGTLDADEFFITRFSMAPILLSRVMDFHDKGIVDYQWGGTFADLSLVFLPRAIYPWKPEKLTGSWHGYTYGITVDVNSRVSINLPQVSEGYINFGYFGVFVGLFLGVLCALMSRYLGHGRTIPSIVLIAFVFSTMPQVESSISIMYGQALQKFMLIVLLCFLVGRYRRGRRGVTRSAALVGDKATV